MHGYGPLLRRAAGRQPLAGLAPQADRSRYAWLGGGDSPPEGDRIRVPSLRRCPALSVVVEFVDGPAAAAA